MMDKYDYPISNQTRLFLAGKKTGDEEFIFGVFPWRIMWNGGSERVILREYLKHSESWLRQFPDGCTLDLLGGFCEAYENRNQGLWIYRFANCELCRSWVPDVGALTPDEKAQLYLWAEIKCEILEVMIEL